MFRTDNIQYQMLVRRFEAAVEQVWPDWEDGECALIDSKPEYLEELMLSSYSLMKHIRSFLQKEKLPYKEGWKVPSLYAALEQAVACIQRSTGPLAHEASKLEHVSRAAYRWLEAAQALDHQSTTGVNQITTTHNNSPVIKRRSVYCWCCKQKIATDDANMLCDECSGPSITEEKTKKQQTCISCKWRLVDTALTKICSFCQIINEHDIDIPRGKCGQCGMPCKSGDFYCDLCKVGQREPNKPTTIYVDSERRSVGSSVMRGPFDSTDKSGYGDILLPNRRVN